VRNETHRGAHHHPQRLEIVHQATTPACWPITRKLRSATPESFIIGPVLRFRPERTDAVLGIETPPDEQHAILRRLGFGDDLESLVDAVLH